MSISRIVIHNASSRYSSDKRLAILMFPFHALTTWVISTFFPSSLGHFESQPPSYSNRDCSYRSYVIIMPHRAWVGRLNRVRFRWVMFDSILIAPLQRKTMLLIIADQGPLALRAAPNRFLVFYSSPVNGELWCPVDPSLSQFFASDEITPRTVVLLNTSSRTHLPGKKRQMH